MGLKLTKKQKRILDFISDFEEEKGISPSYREIAAGLELKSVAGVAEHIAHLEALGALRKVSNAARSLEVVDLSFPETTALFRTHFENGNPAERKVLLEAANILGIDLIEEKTDETD